MHPDVSVIVPAHNEEACLPRRLDAIRVAAARCAARVEVVVVPNRCADRTGVIAEEAGAKVMAEPERNLTRIRNAGVRCSRADTIVTIDADDRFDYDRPQDARDEASTPSPPSP